MREAVAAEVAWVHTPDPQEGAISMARERGEGELEDGERTMGEFWLLSPPKRSAQAFIGS